ncbi:MAG: hypothetical protein U9R25_15495 [Chloroflexota bacterium]|nr:hypothetical protein [Chloroflexota bacterium]
MNNKLFEHAKALSQRQREMFALLLILIVATLFRSWKLDLFPPGLFGDEAVNGLDALDVLAGRPQVFFPANYGREGLHMLVLAPFIQVFGPTALALRLPSVIAGVLTALATYWLGRELFARTRWRGVLVPLLAALFLSTSYWHVHFSRFGIRGVFTPLMAALAFAAFWRGANQIGARTGHPYLWFPLAGVFLGSGAHFYTASRLVPIFLGLFLLAQWVLVWLIDRASHRQPSHPPLLRNAFWPLVAMYGVAAIVFAPLGLFFLRNPGSLTQRAGAVSLFNPEISAGDPLGLMWQAISANFLQFFIPGAGDQAIFYNLPGRPVFDLVTAFLLGAGILICLWAVWRGSSPNLFLLMWFPLMMVPTFLAVDRFPTLPRALAVMPGIFFFPALALGEFLRQGRQSGQRAWLGRLAAILLVLAVVWHASLTWRDYFFRWGPSPETFDSFEGDVAETAQWLETRPDAEVYLSTDIYRHPTFVFLHEQVPLTEFLTYTNPQVHQFDGRNSLPLPSQDQEATYLFTHNAGPDQTLNLLPGWQGFSSMESTPGPGQPALQIARLAPATAATDPPAGLSDDALFPVDIAFSPALRLAGVWQEQTKEDETTLFLLWDVAGPLPGQYHGLQVQVGLQSLGEVEQLTQASSELTYRPTEWAADGQVLSWSRVPLPPEIPEGTQWVIRVVDRATGVPLQPEGADKEGWVLLPPGF